MSDFFPSRTFIGWFMDERVGRRGAFFTLKATGKRYVCHYVEDLPCKACREELNINWRNKWIKPSQ